MNNSLNTHLLHAINALLAGINLYPPQHPANLTLHTTLWEALQQLWLDSNKATIGVVENSLYINNQLFNESNPAATALAKKLGQCAIHGIEFSADVNQQQLKKFIELFSKGNLRGDNFNKTLKEHGVSSIHHVIRDETNTSGSLARETYNHAISTLEKVGKSISSGLVPASTQILPTVDKLVRQTVKKPYALLALSMIKNYDDYTYAHSVNVSVIALAIGRYCQLDAAAMNILGVGGLLHDLGKLKINPDIIKKPGRLSLTEFHQIKLHPELGAQIARQMENIEDQVADIILGHHRHFDGHGYPENIPPTDNTTRQLIDITTVADTYDAITTLRAYRRPNTPRQAVEIMRQLVGTQLNPAYFNALEHTLGTFPVGSIVRLINNEIGIIVDMDALNIENSTVRMLKDSGGNALEQPYDIQLSNSSHEIAGEVDPLIHNIDVNTAIN
jgi:putative nucleotidyltransferase with HDIG domain